MQSDFCCWVQAFGSKVEQLQAANANAHEKLTSGEMHL
jgi:hypothetical protein